MPDLKCGNCRQHMVISKILCDQEDWSVSHRVLGHFSMWCSTSRKTDPTCLVRQYHVMKEAHWIGVKKKTFQSHSPRATLEQELFYGLQLDG
jgi:hypothetical protein